jgi:hypothetical protein
VSDELREIELALLTDLDAIPQGSADAQRYADSPRPENAMLVLLDFCEAVDTGKVPAAATLKALAGILRPVCALPLQDDAGLRKGAVAHAMGLSRGWRQPDYEERRYIALMTAVGHLATGRSRYGVEQALAARFDAPPETVRSLVKSIWPLAERMVASGQFDTAAPPLG